MKTFTIALCLLFASTLHAQTPTSTPIPPETLSVWLPDSIAHSEEDVALLMIQGAAFAASRQTLVTTRLKLSDGAGSLLATLRSADIVAPGVLPDVALLSRQDMLFAASENLIVPTSAPIPTTLAQRLADTQRLCEINGTLYGIPYLLNLPHAASRSTQDLPAPTFDAVLEAGEPFIMPTSADNGFNPTTFLQYTTGNPATQTNLGITRLDADALTSLLDFYAQARTTGVLSDALVNAVTPDAYQQLLNEFELGTVNHAMMLSHEFLVLHATDAALQATALPTRSGSDTTVLDGWCWVIVTQDRGEQMLAMRYIAHMTDTAALAEVATQTRMLPGIRDVLPQVLQAPLLQFYDTLITNAVVFPNDSASLAVERAVQAAVRSVIIGESTVAEAVETALASVE